MSIKILVGHYIDNDQIYFDDEVSMDFEEFEVKLIVADTSTKYSTTIPILEKVEGREYYGRSATQIEGKVSIQKNSEQGLAAFIYGKDGLSTTPIQNIEQGEIDQQNDYIYFISFQFSE